MTVKSKPRTRLAPHRITRIRGKATKRPSLLGSGGRFFVMLCLCLLGSFPDDDRHSPLLYVESQPHMRHPLSVRIGDGTFHLAANTNSGLPFEEAHCSCGCGDSVPPLSATGSGGPQSRLRVCCLLFTVPFRATVFYKINRYSSTFYANPFRIGSLFRAIPHNAASADSEKICVLMMALFCGCTLCTSRKSDEIRAQIFRKMPQMYCAVLP